MSKEGATTLPMPSNIHARGRCFNEDRGYGNGHVSFYTKALLVNQNVNFCSACFGLARQIRFQ